MRKKTTVLDYEKIGCRVRTVRREENLSQEVLAEKCATTSRYLSDIEIRTYLLFVVQNG